jgi:hypothetical protein
MTRKMTKTMQPPLAHAGATPDADRAQRPRLATPVDSGEKLHPGDRVEGLGNFGKLTGELGTIENANEHEAIVKWDEDGRERLGQLWLKKI